MNPRLSIICICAALITVAASSAYAAQKTIYIKPFATTDGLRRGDPTGNLVKDYVSEYIIENARAKYSIISDDEVRQVLAHEELRMTLDTCHDDACMKELMKSIKTDYMIYGTVALTGGKYIITLKMLDRTAGAVRVGKVKTLEFKNRLKLKTAAKDLAAYVISGRGIDMDYYLEKEEKEALKKIVTKAPYGMSFAYRFFMPMSSPVKDYFKYFHGGSLEYAGAFGKYISLFGGVSVLFSSGKSKSEIVLTILGPGYKSGKQMRSLLNDYYIGGRFGYPVSENFYPYASVALKGTWYRYSYGGSAKDYLGVGVDGAAGMAFPIRSVVSLFVEFRGGWGMLIDKGKTDLSGIGCAGGLTVIF